MHSEELKRERARLRAAAWRKANPERYKATVERCKSAKPEKYRALRDAWFAKNSARLKVKNATWRANNKVRAAELVKRWVVENPLRRRAISNKWRANNQDKVNAVLAKRRAAKKNAAPAWANKFFISEAYCLAKLRTEMTGYPWHVDHIVPLTHPLVCGLHVEHNLRVVPGVVNQSKNNRHWPDMP